VMNKIDLVPRELLAERTMMIRDLPTVSISAKTGEGTSKLRTKIVQSVYEEDVDRFGPEETPRKIVTGSTVPS
jgi:50S ribosomal subunit-associated GTPase HflX